MAVHVIKNAIPKSLALAAEASWPSVDWPYWHLYNGKTANKYGSMDRQRIPPACLAALDALALSVVPFIGDAFIDYDLHAAGMHMIPPGGFLARHIDAECHPIRKWRRTHSIVMSVNSDWCPEFGGELAIQGVDGNDFYPPELGRAIIFDTPECWHEVLPVTEGKRIVTLPGMGELEYEEPVFAFRKTLALFAWTCDKECEGSFGANFVGGLSSAS